MAGDGVTIVRLEKHVPLLLLESSSAQPLLPNISMSLGPSRHSQAKIVLSFEDR